MVVPAAGAGKDPVRACRATFREKTEKGRSRLLLTRADSGVRNEAGEAVLTSLDQARFERQIVLPQDVEKYSTEEKIRSLENIIRGIPHAAGADLAGRTYLQDLGRRLEKFRQLSDQKKIVSRP